MLGCPHNSIDQVWAIAALLDGRRSAPIPRFGCIRRVPFATVADRNGYTQMIMDAGGRDRHERHVPRDLAAHAKGTKVVATDSAKQAHYLPAITGVSAWFGSVEDCVEAAVSGRWNGGLR